MNDLHIVQYTGVLYQGNIILKIVLPYSYKKCKMYIRIAFPYPCPNLKSQGTCHIRQLV